MAKGIQIASVFTALGFKVDKKDLDNLQKQLGNLKKQIMSIQKVGKLKIDTNTSELNAAKRALVGINAELTKIKAKTIKVNINRTGGGTGRGGSRAGIGAVGGAAIGSQLGQFTQGVGVTGAAFFAGASILDATQRMEAIESGLLAAAGGAEGATRALSFLNDITERLGINFADNSRSFTNFLAASKSLNISTTETEQVFTSFASAGRVLGLSTADVSGIMKAVTQIMSKGTVQAEELRGQLGERLPGAVGLMSKALGITVEQLNKMLETGQVLSKRDLPKLAKEVLKFAESNGALDKAVKSNLANMARMQNAFFKLQVQIGKAGFVDELTELFQNLASSMNGAEGEATSIGEALAIVVDGLTATINVLKSLPTEALLAGLLLIPFARWFIILEGIFIIIEDIMVGLDGGDSFIFDMINNMTQFEKVLLNVAGILTGVLVTMIAVRKLKGLAGITGAVTGGGVGATTGAVGGAVLGGAVVAVAPLVIAAVAATAIGKVGFELLVSDETKEVIDDIFGAEANERRMIGNALARERSAQIEATAVTAATSEPTETNINITVQTPDGENIEFDEADVGT